MKGKAGVFIFCECVDGNIHDVVFELIGEGQRLAEKINKEVTVVLLGDGSFQPIEALESHGATNIITIFQAELKAYKTMAYTYALEQVIKAYEPEIFLFGATSIGRDLAPRISARVETGLTADCTKLEIEEKTKNLLMTRPAFGGNLMATILCENHRPQMATVRPGVMERLPKDITKKASITSMALSIPVDKVEILETHKLEKTKMNLQDAHVLVAGGRGVGSQEGFDILEEIAEKLGGTVASSRAAVDNNWVSQDRQVGQTGVTVRPNLYVAMGISGAVQHTTGMEESDIIIAINTDENASIFEVADLGIVGDLHVLAPKLNDALDKLLMDAARDR